MPLRDFVPSKNVSHLAGMMDSGTNASFEALLTNSGFSPAGGRAASIVSNRIAACVQPSKRVAPYAGARRTGSVSVPLSCTVAQAPVPSLSSSDLLG